MPCNARRRKILEILELPDIWKVQEEQRSHLLRTAQQGAVDVSYDPFSQEPGEDPGGRCFYMMFPWLEGLCQ